MPWRRISASALPSCTASGTAWVCSLNRPTSFRDDADGPVRAERQVRAVDHLVSGLEAGDDLYVRAVDGAKAHVPPLGLGVVRAQHVHEARVAAAEEGPAFEIRAVLELSQLDLDGDRGVGQEQ